MLKLDLPVKLEFNIVYWEHKYNKPTCQKLISWSQIVESTKIANLLVDVKIVCNAINC